MIPKVIHYCWFGGKPLPKSALKCIDSWKNHFPDYEIKRWDESNFNVNSIDYTRDAYKAKKYAFVSDYARFDILYREGGVYFDTDVEVIRPMYDIIREGAFMGFETVPEGKKVMVAPGLGLAVEAGNVVYKKLIELYKGLTFKLPSSQADPETIVTHTTNLLESIGLVNDSKSTQIIQGITIYPPDYFCPISTIDGKLRITANTRSIHHYAQTWQSPMRKYGRRIILAIGGPRLIKLLKSLIFFKH